MWHGQPGLPEGVASLGHSAGLTGTTHASLGSERGCDSEVCVTPFSNSF